MIRSYPLRYVLPLGVLIVFFLVVGISIVNSVLNEEEDLKKKSLEHIQRSVAALSRLAERGVRIDQQLIEDSVSQVATESHVVGVAVVKPDGHVLFGSNFAWRGKLSNDVLPLFSTENYERALKVRKSEIYYNDNENVYVGMMSFTYPSGREEIRSLSKGVVYIAYDLSQLIKQARISAIQDRTPDFIAMLLISFILSVLLHRYVAKPLENLGVISHRIAEGDFNVVIDHSGPLEIQELSSAFNRMNKRLRESTEKLDAHSKQLHFELEAAKEVLKKQQAHLVHSEKMASIGQLSAGIAHEINNPVAYIASNLEMLFEDVEYLQQLLGPHNKSYDVSSNSDSENIKKVQSQIGQLEIDAGAFDRVLVMTDLLSASLEGTERIKAIIKSLKHFSHSAPHDQELIDINEDILDAAVKIAWGEIKYKAEVVKEYRGVIPYYCQSNDLIQVIINLLINAAQACEENGKVTLSSLNQDNEVKITVSDNGIGISQNNFSKIFDPFFTTKDVGSGTGLGLSISHGIIENYGGTITVKSNSKIGTAFTIILPKQ